MNVECFIVQPKQRFKLLSQEPRVA